MIIDSHQHFWDPATGRYTTLDSSKPIYRAFGPKDLAPTLEIAGVDQTVLVQAADDLAETTAMLQVARRTPFVAGVVGWVPLQQPAAVEAALDRFAGERALCGARHLNHYEPDPDWLMRAPVRRSLRLLAKRNLAFDVITIRPAHLSQVHRLAGENPDLRIVVDHLGQPPLATREWQPWADEVAHCAERPNVYLKLSGLFTTARPAATIVDLQPYVDHALRTFGAERVMWGSDWPVVLLNRGYTDALTSTVTLLSRLTDAERARVLGGTAVSVYGLRPPAPSPDAAEPDA